MDGQSTVAPTVRNWVWLNQILFISLKNIVHTVRKFSRWRYCLAVCDEIFDHFPLFDEILRLIEFCNSVVSELYSTTNRQNCSKSVLVRRPWFHSILLHNHCTLTVYIHAAPQILLFIIWPMGYNGPFLRAIQTQLQTEGEEAPHILGPPSYTFILRPSPGMWLFQAVSRAIQYMCNIHDWHSTNQ